MYNVPSTYPEKVLAPWFSWCDYQKQPRFLHAKNNLYYKQISEPQANTLSRKYNYICNPTLYCTHTHTFQLGAVVRYVGTQVLKLLALHLKLLPSVRNGDLFQVLRTQHCHIRAATYIQYVYPPPLPPLPSLPPPSPPLLSPLTPAGALPCEEGGC